MYIFKRKSTHTQNHDYGNDNITTMMQLKHISLLSLCLKTYFDIPNMISDSASLLIKE